MKAQFTPEALDAHFTCAVCLEDLNPAYSYTKCLHKICGQCATQQQTKEQCPICRKKSAPRPDHTMTAVVAREQSLRRHRCSMCEALVSTDSIADHRCDMTGEEAKRVALFADIAAQAGMKQQSLVALVQVAMARQVDNDGLLSMILAESSTSTPAQHPSSPDRGSVSAEKVKPAPLAPPAAAVSSAAVVVNPDAMTFIDFDQFAVGYATDTVELFLSALMKKIVTEQLALTVSNIQLIAFGVPESFQDEQMICMMNAMQVQKRPASGRQLEETVREIERDVLEHAARVVVLVSSDQAFNYLARKMTREGKHFVVVHGAPAGSMHENRLSMFAAAAWRLTDVLPGFAPLQKHRDAATTLEGISGGSLTSPSSQQARRPNSDQPEQERQVMQHNVTPTEQLVEPPLLSSVPQASQQTAAPAAAAQPAAQTAAKKDSKAMVNLYKQQLASTSASMQQQLPPPPATTSTPHLSNVSEASQQATAAPSTKSQPATGVAQAAAKKDSKAIVNSYKQQLASTAASVQEQQPLPPAATSSLQSSTAAEAIPRANTPAPSNQSVPTPAAIFDAQVDLMRAKGNEHFANQRFAQAASCYSDGIARLERFQQVEGGAATARAMATLLSNRALCLSKLGQIQEALRDAIKARTADPTFLKGYLRSGRILADIGKRDQAIDALLAGADVMGGDAEDDSVRKEIVALLRRLNSERTVQEIRSKPDSALVLCYPLLSLVHGLPGDMGKEVAAAATVILQTPTRRETTKEDILGGSPSWEALFQTRKLGKFLHVDWDLACQLLPRRPVVALNMMELLAHFDKPLHDRFMATNPCARCGKSCTQLPTPVTCPVCRRLKFCSVLCLLQSVWWHVTECRISGRMPRRNDKCAHGWPLVQHTPQLFRLFSVIEMDERCAHMCADCADEHLDLELDLSDPNCRSYSRVMLSCCVDSFVDRDYGCAVRFFKASLQMQKELPYCDEPTVRSWGIPHETLLKWATAEDHTVLGYMLYLLHPRCSCMTFGLISIIAAAHRHAQGD